jgi:hypothetical protein
MLKDKVVELIEPILNNLRADPLVQRLCIHNWTKTSDKSLPCLDQCPSERTESNQPQGGITGQRTL